MRIISGFRLLAWLALGLMISVSRLQAQSFGLSIGAPLFVGVSNSFNFVIAITNLTGISQTVTVTNVLSGTSLQFGTPTATLGSNLISGSNVIFFLGTVATNGTATLNVPVEPISVGFLTNMVVVATNGTFYGSTTNPAVVQVTNPAPVVDMVVTLTGPASQVFSNDWMVYRVNVANLGVSTNPAVLLTNTLPPGVGFKSVSPSLTRLGTGSNVVFNLGKLPGGASTNLYLTVQPTNAGTWTFTSVVSTNGVIDTNPGNNSASLSLVVSNFLSSSGQLTATIVSTQKFNQLSGRLEQNIVLSNAGPATVGSARVIVLTNLLSNAVGTNNGHPFLTHAAALAAGEEVGLVLQFYPIQTNFPFANAQLQPVGVSPPDFSLATTGLTPTNILLFVKLPSGGRLIEFPSLTNRTYTVAYSSNLINWLVAQPLTITPANYTYWIDYGPPATVSHPTNTPVRFYRVFLNP